SHQNRKHEKVETAVQQSAEQKALPNTYVKASHARRTNPLTLPVAQRDRGETRSLNGLRKLDLICELPSSSSQACCSRA
ncbi:hypothetical protein AVEN_62542-1, partial [Araneus ventricosus]